MREINASGQSWEVKGFWPWVPIKGTSMELGQELMGVTEWMPATVPGAVQYDLYRAGLIPHPYKDMNSLACEWVENRWWMYRTTIRRPEPAGEKLELVFKGLDYEAAIYAGTKLLGEHKGMFHEAAFDVTELLRQSETLELSVLLRHAPDEMAQIGKTSDTFTQKSRFTYKWDFSTRLVPIGIWDDAVLRVHGAFSFGEAYVRTEAAAIAPDGTGAGRIHVNARVEANRADAAAGLALTAECRDPDGKLVAARELALEDDGAASAVFDIEGARLWYPNGYGEQPLYEVKLILRGGAEKLDERTYRVGIRQLEYVANDGAPEEALPYTVKINGRRIYIRGVNMTPLDHLYANVTDGQYAWMVRLMKEGNANLVRVWGGGLIEKKRFYELCDENGIMIWQEFIQSSSGVDNIPSKRPEFLALLEKTARAALADRRNHVSLTVWSGGNELMSEPNKPSTMDDSNLAILKELVREYDPQRLFLPTSASGPVEYITEEKGLGHDVHGHWKYQGDPYHYELYGENDNLFHSEFGVDGLSRMKSLRKFLNEGERRPKAMKDSLVWRHHGEWWDTLARDEAMFGKPGDLAVFSDASQWMQAEGLRFILEANRRRKFSNSGSIIWQLNEPWPNVSCTNLVDYYGEPKMAYYWTKAAFAPLHVSLDYRKLKYAKGEPFRRLLYVHAHEPGVAVSVRAEVLDSAGSVLHRAEYEGATAHERALPLGELAFAMPETADGLVFVRLAYRTEQGSAVLPPYVFSTADGPAYEPAWRLDGAGLEARQAGEWRGAADAATVYRAAFELRNDGERAALHVHAEETTDGFWMEADEQYVTLFPGETHTVDIRCVRKSGGGLLAEEAAAAAAIALPQVRFRAMFGGSSGRG
ncbi:glycoside hydrolase family 2 protein [Cohnella fermenti]|uniref:beta-mannosidase n=1 Tax=Cohnella fermenti TaxID=2565925 RepID=A0A4S4BMS2_9BACL|nr:glycoside hydrolase family 2 TIM barrel-domain containing protein [Cohnella fermenti]THF73743.1 hypothetical protein E6C55_28030 [Cohnella fermenti]